MRKTEIKQGLRPAFRTLIIPFGLDTSLPLFAGDCVLVPGSDFADLDVGETIEVYQSCPAPLDSVKLAMASVVGVNCGQTRSIFFSHAINDQRFTSADRLVSFRLAKQAWPNVADHENFTAIYLEKVD